MRSSLPGPPLWVWPVQVSLLKVKHFLDKENIYNVDIRAGHAGAAGPDPLQRAGCEQHGVAPAESEDHRRDEHDDEPSEHRDTVADTGNVKKYQDAFTDISTKVYA